MPALLARLHPDEQPLWRRYWPLWQAGRLQDEVELPLLAKLKVAGFVAEAGPQVGYLLAVKGTGVLGGPSAPEGVDGYQRWAAGYVAGVGYELVNGLGVSLRYDGALTNVRQLPENSSLLRARNAAFQLQVSYLWQHQ